MYYLLFINENIQPIQTFYTREFCSDSEFSISILCNELSSYEDTYIELPSKKHPDHIFTTLLDINEKREKTLKLKVEKNFNLINLSFIDTLYLTNCERLFVFKNIENVNKILTFLKKYKIKANENNYKISLKCLDDFLCSNLFKEWSVFYYNIWEEYEKLGFHVDDDICFLNEHIKFKIEFEEYKSIYSAEYIAHLLYFYIPDNDYLLEKEGVKYLNYNNPDYQLIENAKVFNKPYTEAVNGKIEKSANKYNINKYKNIFLLIITLIFIAAFFIDICCF